MHKNIILNLWIMTQFPTPTGFSTKIVMKLLIIIKKINLPPTSSHLHPLQVENCNSNSRLVVDEDDNGQSRLARLNVSSPDQVIMKNILTLYPLDLWRRLHSFYFLITTLLHVLRHLRWFYIEYNPLLAPAVTVGERRELWILPPFFFGLFFCL